jgi:hypothetical protein
MLRCEFLVNVLPEDDEDGQCLASAAFLVKFRRKSDGYQGHSSRCAEHRDLTNDMWEKVEHEEVHGEQ